MLDHNLSERDRTDLVFTPDQKIEMPCGTLSEQGFFVYIVGLIKPIRSKKDARDIVS